MFDVKLSEKISKYLRVLQSTNIYYKLDNSKYEEFSSRYSTFNTEDQQKTLKNDLYQELNRIFTDDNLIHKYELYKEFAKVENIFEVDGGSLKTRIKKIKKY